LRSATALQFRRFTDDLSEEQLNAISNTASDFDLPIRVLTDKALLLLAPFLDIQRLLLVDNGQHIFYFICSCPLLLCLID
jgi:hypothetical protein